MTVSSMIYTQQAKNIFSEFLLKYIGSNLGVT